MEISRRYSSVVWLRIWSLVQDSLLEVSESKALSAYECTSLLEHDSSFCFVFSLTTMEEEETEEEEEDAGAKDLCKSIIDL